jgi:hypothetical protein
VRFLPALFLALLSTVGFAQAASDSGDLFGRGWISTAVLKHGEEHPLFDGTKIRVNFAHRSDYDIVSWKADCNYFGSDVFPTEQRLFTGQIEGSEQYCSKRSQRRQDRWMSRFFGADPRWRIRRDEKLKLRVGGRVIRLRRRQ